MNWIVPFEHAIVKQEAGEIISQPDINEGMDLKASKIYFHFYRHFFGKQRMNSQPYNSQKDNNLLILLVL